MPEIGDPRARRHEAELALGGEKIAAKEKARDKQRREAILAMEGEAHRERRETREAAARLKASATRAVAEEKVHQMAMAAAKIAHEGAARAAQEEAALASVAARQSQNREAHDTTERLKQNSPGLSSLRTIKTDMAKAVKEEGLSLAKIVTATRYGGNPLAIGEHTSRTLIGLSLILVLAAGGGVFYWWWQNRPAATTAVSVATTPTGQTILTADRDEGVEASALNSVNQARAALTMAVTSPEAVTGLNRIYFYQTSRESISLTRFTTLLGLTTPDDLTRHLRDNYLFGFYNSGETRSRFLVLQTSFFDQAWAAMFAWERYLPSDLAPLLDLPATKQVTWADKIIKNKDVRVAADDAGHTLLLYGFLDEKNILIARNETAFTKVFERLLNES